MPVVRNARLRGAAAMGSASAISQGPDQAAVSRDCSTRRALFRASGSNSDFRSSSSPAAMPHRWRSRVRDGACTSQDPGWKGRFHVITNAAMCCREYTYRGWRLYANSCGILVAVYAIWWLSIRLFVTLCLFVSSGLIVFKTDRRRRWQALEESRRSQKQALLEAEAQSQTLAQQARQYERRLDAQWVEMQRLREESSSFCKICFDREPGCALLPCKHHAFCTPCAHQLKECKRDACCPLCRTPITGIFETFTC